VLRSGNRAVTIGDSSRLTDPENNVFTPRQRSAALPVVCTCGKEESEHSDAARVTARKATDLGNGEDRVLLKNAEMVSMTPFGWSDELSPPIDR
jgi:hypothetical protein